MRDLKGRRSIRLPGWNYANGGYYFVMVDVQDKLKLFGEIKNGRMGLNQAGMMVENKWNEIPGFYSGIDVDEFVVMPDHVHGIILIKNDGRIWESARTNSNPNVGVDSHIDPITGNLSLPQIIQRFKILTTNIYIRSVRENDWPKFHQRLWQRNYYERIIRNRLELDRIRLYIEDNPRQWQ